jgi:microcystin-dependent protein
MLITTIPKVNNLPGTPTGSLPASEINQIIDELQNIITGFSGTLSAGSVNQCYTQIKSYVDSILSISETYTDTSVSIHALTALEAIADNDEFSRADSVNSYVRKKSLFSSIKSNVLNGVHALTEKTTTVDDNDEFLQNDSAASYVKKKSLFSTIKAVLLSYISGIITPAGSIQLYGGVSAPTGFMLCNGAAVSRSTYASLYGILTTNKGTVTISIATPGEVTLATHGLATGDCIELTTTSALPTGLSANTNYYVIYENANTFWLATSYANALAGTKINTSGSQSGVHTLRYCPFGISGSSNFLLPDMRGAAPNGVGTSTAYVYNETLGLGNMNNDQLQAFWMTVRRNSDGSASYIAPGSGAGSEVYGGGTTLYTGATAKDIITDGTHGTPRTGYFTKGKAIGVNFIIKY